MTNLTTRPPQEQLYLDKVRRALLQLSLEEYDLADAIDEWSYSGNCFDLDTLVGQCELCGHFPVRYQFEIVNEYSDYELLVGSKCIRKFRIRNSKRVTRDRSKLVSDAKQRDAINSLVELSTRDSDFTIDSFIDYLRARSRFTPKQMDTLCWRFEKYGINHTPACFKVSIRRSRERKQLQELSLWKLERLLPYLSRSQQLWCLNNWGQHA